MDCVVTKRSTVTLNEERERRPPWYKDLGAFIEDAQLVQVEAGAQSVFFLEVTTPEGTGIVVVGKYPYGRTAPNLAAFLPKNGTTPWVEAMAVEILRGRMLGEIVLYLRAVGYDCDNGDVEVACLNHLYSSLQGETGNKDEALHANPV